MSHRSYREASRANWGQDETHGLTLEQINTGAILRIADATEKMAHRHTELIEQRDHFESSTIYWRDEHDRLQRRLIAAKGQITKLKKRAVRATGEPK